MLTDDGYRATSELLLMDAIGRGDRAESAVAIGAAFAIAFRHHNDGRAMESAEAMIRADELVKGVCGLLGGPPNLRELIGGLAMQVGARAYHADGSLHPGRYT